MATKKRKIRHFFGTNRVAKAAAKKAVKKAAKKTARTTTRTKATRKK